VAPPAECMTDVIWLSQETARLVARPGD
jgi:hypothetical protein